MSEKKNMKYTLAALIIIAVLLTSYLYISNSQTQPVQKLSCEKLGILEFPRDEGNHSMPEERWVIYLNLSSVDKNYYFMISWDISYMNGVKSYNVELMYSDISSKDIVLKHYKSLNGVNTSSNALNLSWDSSNGDIFSLIRENPQSMMKDAKYHLQIKTVEKDWSFSANLRIQYIRQPVLFGLDGSAYMGIFGTFYGYLGPSLSIGGQIDINGTRSSVTGRGMTQHIWGFTQSNRMEILYMQMKNVDLFISRFYEERGKDPVREYVYIIYPDNHTAFMTGNNRTIGASIGPWGMNDLKGEKYTIRITDYIKDPKDSAGMICYPDGWYVNSSYGRYKAIFYPMMPGSSPEQRSWEGFMVGEDKDGYGWGFAHIFRYYITHISIRNVNFSAQGSEVNVSANISSSLPLFHVWAEYNLSFPDGTWENGTYANMSWNGAYWVAEIPNLGAHKMTLRVIAEDEAYSMAYSEEKTYTLQ